MRSFRSAPSFLLIASLAACGAPAPTPDVSSGTDASDAPRTDVPTSSVCVNDLSCADAVFCNGVERCMPGAARADSRGCVAGTSPCESNQTCNESMARCELQCSVAVDADGDGHRAEACGGDDCDDMDAQRFPGNPEVCDSANHDEDCNTSTFGARDNDSDMYPDAVCCNVDSSGLRMCGTDCDDANPARHPGLAESCNGIDDNCDGVVDEGVRRTFFPDADHDNFGDHAGTPTYACTPAAGLAENTLDCDDTNAAISPVAAEVCDLVDNNCDGRIDESPASSLACAAQYGSPAFTTFACTSGSCGATCTASHLDCNGRLDDGCETDGNVDPAHCGSCSTSCGTGGVCTAGVCDSITNISAGAGYACAVRSSGRVACWGANFDGQLGDGTNTDRSTPVLVLGISNAVQVSAGRFDDDPLWNVCASTCVRTTSNSVVCWGCNLYGQQGAGSTGGVVPTPGATALNLPTFDTRYGIGMVNEVSVGGGFVLAVDTVDRQFGYSWGTNLHQELQRAGVGGTTATPGRFDSAVGQQSVHLSGGSTHACSLGSTRGLECWGQNVYGQIGNGVYATGQWATVAPYTLAVPSGAVAWIDVSAGDGFTCAVTDDDASTTRAAGRVFCWGSAPSADASSPRVVTGISNAVKVASGGQHACALLETGTVRCWGQNSNGELGNGTTNASSTPVDVIGLTAVTQLSVGRGLSCALSGGRAWCWGSTNGSTPALAPGL